MLKKIGFLCLVLVFSLGLFLSPFSALAYNVNFITPIYLAGAYTNVAYSQAIRFSYDGPYSPSANISGLPAGITIGGPGYGNGQYGIARDTDGNYSITLTGTPVQPGSFTITVEVFDNTHSVDVTQNFIFTAKTSGSSGMNLLTTSLPSGTIGQSYFTTLNYTSSSSYCVSAILTGLPTGVIVYGSSPQTPNQLNCIAGGQSFSLYGTPTQSGTFYVSVYLTDNAGASIAKNFMLTVAASGVAGAFSLSKLSFDFFANQGDTAQQQQSLTFTNVSNSQIYYTLSQDTTPNWSTTGYAVNTSLTAYPNSPTGLGASINPSNLSPGFYTTNVRISGNFSGSPLIVPINLTVYAANVAPQPPLPVGNGNARVPFIRMYNAAIDDHFYTSDRSEAGVAANYGYRTEGEMGYLYKFQQTDSQPVYRMYSPQLLNHFYTTDPTDEANAQAAGFRLEGIIGYMPKYASVGQDTQIYRLFNPASGDHFYTVDFTERDAVVRAGYVSEGSLGGRLLSSGVY